MTCWPILFLSSQYQKFVLFFLFWDWIYCRILNHRTKVEFNLKLLSCVESGTLTMSMGLCLYHALRYRLIEKQSKTSFASDSLPESIGVNDNPLESTWRLASDSGLDQIMIMSISVSAPCVPGFFSPLLLLSASSWMTSYSSSSCCKEAVCLALFSSSLLVKLVYIFVYMDYRRITSTIQLNLTL